MLMTQKQDKGGSLTSVEPEKCWVIIGFNLGLFWIGRLKYLNTGDPTRVTFPEEEVFCRDEDRADVIGFFHTHPNSMANPSAVDHGTMQAWVMALGKPLVCAIHGKNGIRSWFYDAQGTVPRAGRIFKILGLVAGVNPIVINTR